VDPVGDHVTERVGADAGHHMGGGGRDGRLPRRGSGEGAAAGSIGLHNYVIGCPGSKPAVNFLGGVAEGFALVGGPPCQNGAVLSECGNQVGVGRSDDAREPAGAVPPHAGRGGEQRGGGQLAAQREQQGRLAAAADQRHQRPAPQLQSLSGAGQVSGPHGSAGRSDLPDLAGQHDGQSH